MSAPAQAALARMLHRLEVAAGKLDLASKHWKTPGDVACEDIGAVGVVHEVRDEIGSLYCDLNDWAHEEGGLPDGPLVETWQPPTEEAPTEGAQS